MSMPHPCVLMAPFGCVVCQRTSRTGASVTIYRDKTEIENLHTAFKNKPNGSDTLADLILATKDYQPATPSWDHASVIAFADITMHLHNPVATDDPYFAYRLHASVNAPEPLPDFQNPEVDGSKVVMESGWFYFLLPYNVDAFRDEDDDKHHRRKRSSK